MHVVTGSIGGLRVTRVLSLCFASPQTVLWARRTATTGASGTDANHNSGTTGSSHSTTAADLRAALRTLSLNEDCTDAEIKRAFHAFAILHHPDTKAAAAAASAETMHRGTEAYHLLRRTPQALRQRILQEGSRSAGRFRGPFSDFNFTAEEYAKAQRIYEGDRQRRRSRHRGSRSDGEDQDGDLFDLTTEDGRRRAARFEAAKARIAELRRHGRRDDLPPWRVDDEGEGAHDAGRSGTGPAAAASSTAGFNAASSRQRGSAGPGQTSSSSSSAHSSSSRSPGSAGPRNPNRLGLHFFNATVTNLKQVRELYKSRPGFAGMDGSSYDNPGSAARVAPELSANPHLRQYILMKHRAQEKAVVDRAVRQPLLLFLILVCGGALVLIGVKIARSSGDLSRRDEELRRRDEERGGA